MQVKAASVEIIIMKDFPSETVSVNINTEGDDKYIIEGLAHAMIINPQIRRLFNLAGRKTNEERSKNSN